MKFLVYIKPTENNKIETKIVKNDKEIILNDKETKELWKELSVAESFDFKIPF